MSNISRQNSQVKGKGKEVIEERPPKKVANEYQLKAIEWVDALGQTQRLKIITQNGNVLLLRGLIEIKPYDRSFVTYDYLVELLGDYLLRTIPNGEIGEAEIQKGILEDLNFNQLSKISQEKQLNSLSKDSNPFNNSSFTRTSIQDYHHTLNTALSIIPSLQSGLDVNVRFNSIHGFEPTAELSVFDIFNVELVHGWVVDPQDEETWEVVVGKCGSYNKAVECVVSGDSLSKGVVLESNEKLKVSNIKPEKNSDSMENSKSTATQLTYHGLLTLSETLPPGNLCFSTLFKHPQTLVLYILVTDAGFVHERSAVWESLTDVDQNASEFVNGKFIKGETTGGDYVEVSEHHEISGGGDQDLQQQEDDREAEYLRKPQSDAISQSSVGSSFTTASSSEKERRKDKKKDCIIT
ncbi:2288_t:CDS:2 [Diversispora eburnea]|uniref:2288_t:CDS:1 n=1 Tax=Diversispora eburnea TaxID=1213867 RepID=A0A9N8W0Z2_9GLOM|nr:2288_t:CDS:2 [Diversispora eburnea]